MRLFETRPGDDGLPGPERALAVLALVTGTLMAVVDTTMINLALPTIAADLNVSASRAVWITNLFQVVCAAFLLVFAGISELITRRRLYLFGLATFVAAALGRRCRATWKRCWCFVPFRGWVPPPRCRLARRCIGRFFPRGCWAAPWA